MSPFSKAGPRLVAAGYSAIPIVPNDKIPGNFSAGEYRFFAGWNQFCRKLPTAFQVKMWSTFPNAGVGVALGNNVVAVDIDRDAYVAPVLAVLPPVVVAKKGAKGLTVFYRADTSKLRSRAFKIDGAGVLDFLSDGKQTVVPPSVHPRTREPYVWTTARTLEDTPASELPLLTPEHFEALCEVMRDCGWQAEVAYEAEPVESRSDVADFFRRLNEDALANLDAWVPHVGLYFPKREPDGWRAVAEWRPSSSGRSIHKRARNLSFDRKGIVDFGDGGKTYTPLNIVLKVRDLADWQIDKAAVWLGEQLGYDFSPKIMLTSKPKALPAPETREVVEAEVVEPEVETEAVEAAAQAYREAKGGELPPHDPETGEVLEEPASAPVAQLPVATTKPVSAHKRKVTSAAERNAALENLTYPAGLVGQLVDYIVGSSRSPSRVLSLAAALSFVGAIAGRQYKGPTGLMTNLYTLALADAGFGKDHARDCLKTICTKGGFTRWLGGSKIKSGSAIRTRLEQNPSTIWLLDEFGGFVGEITSHKSGPHVRDIRDYLLELFSAAKTLFNGADYAGVQGEAIHNPNACIYATSTPADFWGSMTSRGVADGFLPRFLIFPVDGPEPEKVKPLIPIDTPPAALIEGLRAVSVPRGGNLAGRTTSGSTPINPTLIAWGPGTEEAWNAFERHCKAEGKRAREDVRAIWTRVAETCLKVAGIIALGVDPVAPVIYPDQIEWAAELLILCTRATIDQVSGRLADNDRQREHLDVKRWILDAGTDGMTRTEIAKRVNGRFVAKRITEILQTLEDEEKEIHLQVAPPSPNGGRKASRYIAMKYLGAESDPSAEVG